MKILLVKNVENLGTAGDTVTVANGYARNFLFPKKLAVKVSPGAMKMADQYRKSALEKEAKALEAAEELATRLKEVICTILVSADENGHLYGGISEREIAAELEKAGFELDKRHILLEEHIKNLGEYQVPVRLHGSIQENITVRIEQE
jgi:large subunit ribosomal protein L9